MRFTDLMSRSRSSTSNVCGFIWFKYSNCFRRTWWSMAMSVQQEHNGIDKRKNAPIHTVTWLVFTIHLHLMCYKQHTISSFKVLLGLNQSPESTDLLPFQLIQFCSDMMADKVQLLGQLTLLYYYIHTYVLESCCIVTTKGWLLPCK